ncbi:MAG: esterase [Chloroflexi bacterium]|nr:esterase [Chloroflexota bacterium]
MTSPSRIDLLPIESTALKGNRLGDPHQRELTVYVPAGYDEQTERRYPVCFLLSSHGRTSYYHISWNQWDETLPQRLDRLIRTGQMPPAIVALPDAWTRFGGSQYLDSAIGNYSSYLVDELVPLVDATYRTLAGREHRGILGHSSGGYGALVNAMQHPDVFGAIGCRAGDMYWEYTAIPGLSHFHQQLEKWGGIEEFITRIPAIQPKNGAFWEAIHTVMQSMAYATNPASPLGFDPPIDLETGAIIPEVWERWLQFDPVRMIDRSEYQTALKTMKSVFIEVGRYDEYQLQVGSRLLHRKLDQYGIIHTYEEFPDGHRDTSYRYDVAFPKIVKALSE